MSNKNTDEVVLQLFYKVKEKQREIAASEKPKWNTHCSFSKSDDVDVKNRINIMTVTNIDVLVDIYAFLLQKQTFWTNAVAELGIKKPFKWQSHSGLDWFQDIQSRIKQISINEKKEELKVLEKRLDALISVEQRRELELAEIQKLMDY